MCAGLSPGFCVAGLNPGLWVFSGCRKAGVLLLCGTCLYEGSSLPHAPLADTVLAGLRGGGGGGQGRGGYHKVVHNSITFPVANAAGCACDQHWGAYHAYPQSAAPHPMPLVSHDVTTPPKNPWLGTCTHMLTAPQRLARHGVTEFGARNPHTAAVARRVCATVTYPCRRCVRGAVHD